MPGTSVLEHAHGVPTSLSAGTKSYNPADFPGADARQELWRYTPLARLRPLFDTGLAAADVTVSAAAGVSAVVTASASAPISTYVPADRLAARLWTEAANCAVISIDKDADIAEPVYVDVVASTPATARIIVQWGEHSKASVVIRHKGPADLGTTIVAEVAAGAQARLTTVQGGRPAAVTAVYAHHVLQRDAVLRSHVVSLGGACTRVVPTVQYAGPGADAQLEGIGIAGSDEHVEHRSLVDHTVANCRSNVVYKNVLTGDEAAIGRTVWVGDVIIHAQALGTDTYEMNRNLVLGDHARADSVPNLEIETGEIAGAGHASTTGRLDDEHVFYLQSRGIGEKEAQRLIVRGFFEDLLGSLDSPSVAEDVRARLEGVLR